METLKHFSRFPKLSHMNLASFIDDPRIWIAEDIREALTQRMEQRVLESVKRGG